MAHALGVFLEEESQISVLAHNVELALNTLGRSVVISGPIREAHGCLQKAIRDNDAGRVEQFINDLDSLTILLQPNCLEIQSVAQYRLLRRLIFGLQEVWPYHFL